MKRLLEGQAQAIHRDAGIQNPELSSIKGKRWIFTFAATDPETGEPETFTLQSARGRLRSWADVTTLCGFIAKTFGVTRASITFNPEHFTIED